MSNNDNEFTGNNNDIIKNMVLENDDENIGSDNEMLECVELERKCKESIVVGGLQGVKFSLNVVVGGEEMASREYLEDDMSANKFPWVFCALHRWRSNDELVSPAYFEGESVAWCYGEKYIEREREREKERKRDI